MNQEFKPTHTVIHSGEQAMFLCPDPLCEDTSIVYREDSIGLLSLVSYYNKSLLPIPAQLTPKQMLEAAQAKGIKWTKKWPKVSGWYPVDHEKDALWLRWVDVDKRTISMPILYCSDEITAMARATCLTCTKYSDIYFAEPWWV